MPHSPKAQDSQDSPNSEPIHLGKYAALCPGTKGVVLHPLRSDELPVYNLLAIDEAGAIAQTFQTQGQSTWSGSDGTAEALKAGQWLEGCEGVSGSTALSGSVVRI